MELLRNKGEFTRFEILLEIKQSQPHIRQKDISESLGITVQAVSKQIKELIRRGLVKAGPLKAQYRLTPKGLNKLHEDSTNLEKYISKVMGSLKIERTWPALAVRPIKAGDEVGLIMREGILYAVASDHPDAECIGVAVTDADSGEDVGLRGLKGRIKMKRGRVTIIKLPSIKEGGSKAVDLARIGRVYDELKPDRIGVMGTVARSVLNKIGLKNDFEFGVTRAATMAALRGLNVLVLAAGRMANRVIEELERVNVDRSVSIVYELKNGKIHKGGEFLKEF